MAQHRKIRIRLSFLVALVVTVLFITAFAVVTPLVLNTLNSRLKRSLVEQTKSFAVLSAQPIGDAFLLYQDSGRAILQQQIEKIVDTDVYISNVAISDVNGKVLYEKNPGSKLTISSEEAQTFEPVFHFDKDGYVTRVAYPFKEQSGAHRYTMIYAVNSSDIKATLDTVTKQVLSTALGLLVVGDIIFVLLIEWLFVGPLKRMSRLAAAISAGDYDVFIKLRRTDEIRDLGDALNDMAQKLKADIERLKKAEQLKTEFLIISSHNLRTPLTVITGYIDLLKNLPQDDETKKYLQTIEESAQELTNLTNDMLAVAELEGSRPQLKRERINLREMIEKLRPKIEKLFADKSQTITLPLPDSPLFANTQATYLQTILWNLLDNANKFTPEKGHIELRASNQGNHVEIAVIDNGIGIKPEEMKDLFTKFHRGTSIMQYEYEGAGLGLYMTKLMIGLLGGEIHAASTLGKGTTITLTLPSQSATKPEDDPQGDPPTAADPPALQ